MHQSAVHIHVIPLKVISHTYTLIYYMHMCMHRHTHKHTYRENKTTRFSQVTSILLRYTTSEDGLPNTAIHSANVLFVFNTSTVFICAGSISR